jgi:2-dehydro-3-deoxyglucarate aldolase/4-hydroxy-2-oxoheptanedioate aldolase
MTAMEITVTTPSWKDRVRAGEPSIGTFLGMGSAVSAEVCALGGFDWLLVDLEHGAGGEEALLGQILAAGVHDVPIVVRTESAARIRSGRVLDMGAAGVMFPRLDTAAEVVEAIAHLRYPPAGDRGVAGYNRARRFGTDGRTAAQVNDSIIGIVQIETLSALNDVDAIAGTPGVDVLFVGPGDLSTALGVPGRTDAPEFRAAATRIIKAAKDNGIAPGILARDVVHAASCLDDGYTFVGIGSDAMLLASAAQAVSSTLRTAR